MDELAQKYGYSCYAKMTNSHLYINFETGVSVNISESNSFEFRAIIDLVKLNLGPCSPFTDEKHFKHMEALFLNVYNKAKE